MPIAPVLQFLGAQWKLILIAILIASNYFFYGEWQDVKTELAVFSARVDDAAKTAEEEKKKLEDSHKHNLKVVKDEYEAKLPQVRDNAVANYVAAHPVRLLPRPAGQSTMPGTSSGKQENDGASQEPVLDSGACPLDEKLIKDAAEDALVLTQWQEWCIRNGCKVEE